MADTELPDLSIEDDVGDEDLVYLTRTITELSYGTKSRNLIGGVGNVLRFGADPSGSSYSSDAINEAIDSQHVTIIGPGDWRLDKPLTATAEKIIICSHGLMPSYARHNSGSSVAPWNPQVGDSCRFIVDSNIDFFQVSWGDVYILGMPMCDSSEVAVHTSAALRFVLNETRARTWGGRFELMGMGNHDTIANEGNGMDLVAIDWGPLVEEPPSSGEFPAENSFLSGMEWRLRGQDVRHGIYAPAEADAGQFANTTKVWMHLDGFKKAVDNQSINLMEIEGVLQARGVIHPNEFEANKHAITFGPAAGNCIYDVVPYDFGDGSPDGNGLYKPQFRVENNAAGTKRKLKTGSDVNDNEGIYLPEHPYAINAPVGFIPSVARDTSSGRNGVYQPYQDSVWVGAEVSASPLTVAVYSGVGVTDLSTLTNNLATEGLSVSTNITVTNDQNIFSHEKAPTTITPNADAVTDVDIIEVRFFPSDKVNYVWILLDDRQEGFTEAQVLRKLSGAVLDNVVQDFPVSSFLPVPMLINAPSGSTCDEVMLRFRGPLGTDTMTVLSISAGQLLRDGKTPVITVEGGKTVYGDMVFAANMDFTGLPTADPLVAGRLWNNSGVLTVSAG